MCVTALRLRGSLFPRPPSVAEQGREPRVTLHGVVARLRSGGCGREITDPATGALVGRVEPDVAELDTAVAAAKAAQPDWAARGHDERRALLNRAADAVEANTEALAVTVARGCACCGCAGLSLIFNLPA